MEMRVLTSFSTSYLECVDGAYMHPTERLVVFIAMPLEFKSKQGLVEGIRMYHLYTTFS